ncbi:MAG: hypothetical protein KatS3mg038_3838 [Candidatus Kapaibacterium sp.]|nr:MAG: hypothetical protein KatS3mg038_0351 [Candidatus Kapabacteria bacterium]GIV50216.1 MAG: hypothetical protein KatS3mg038_0737 [Candidatus Kapabacteria bacterium]GIV51116.1 MAG: hypothetical protein KatS3mg038_1637 [Candidatus Kapabacteria bacterium]GIV51161.1 MAG: hypothetical protein KatS3mg038_1682 [Candidatus Kapabacteria bacterium]GIV51880.1 MAG: hypothetical protein KatS3mg038_2401 [Candidatus Kapabacteria bacterium]
MKALRPIIRMIEFALWPLGITWHDAALGAAAFWMCVALGVCVGMVETAWRR